MNGVPVLAKKKNALGKGLSSLLSVDPTEPLRQENTVETIIREVPLELLLTDIEPNPFQPRIDFHPEELRELADSIAKQGLLQPIAVRQTNDGKYQIISGERRFRAFHLLNKQSIPVTVLTDVDDVRMLEMALVENIQRENLNDIETALSYQRLLFECGLSHLQLSEQVGKSRSSITNILRLLKLPTSIQEMVREGKLSMGHARALLAFGGDSKKQEIVAKQIISEGLSVRAVEKIANPVTKIIDEPEVQENTNTNQFESLTDEWQNSIGLGITLKSGKNGSGKVEIKFKSEDELQIISELFGSFRNG